MPRRWHSAISAASEALASSLEQRIERVRKRVASVAERPGVFFQIAENPIVSAGKNSFIDRLIDLAGGKNLAGDLEGYPRFSWENIMVLQPEVVLLDLWGAPDDLAENDPMWGVYRFKEGLGGEVVRTGGAWDYPASPVWYPVYTRLVPRLLDFMRARGRRQVRDTLGGA